MEEDKKAIDARNQLSIWNKLLEGRMILQNLLTATNKLPEIPFEVDESLVRSVTKLLTTLVRLRSAYKSKSRLADEETPTTEGEENLDSEQDLLSSGQIEELELDQLHKRHKRIRAHLIEKWYEKTKIGSIPKKGYTALELSPLQLIEHALRDKQRLIRRTQLNRASLVDDDYKPEVFNDDDFYHQLLKEVINKDENRRWVELQRARGKLKKKIDTRASKGRKIRLKTHPKLVNFMAPRNVIGQDSISEQIRNELLTSLFGVISPSS